MPLSADKKILDRLVKHMKKGLDDPLTPLLDEYFQKRNNPNVVGRRLSEYHIETIPRPRPHGRLSPSSIGGCERQAAFSFLGVTGRKRIDPQSESIFDDGEWRHHRWQFIFSDMERVLGRDRFRCISIEEPVQYPKLFIAGHLDVVVAIKVGGEWVYYVIDIKGANSFAFGEVTTKFEARSYHAWQLLAYMRARKIKRGILFYESKNNNDNEPFYVEFTASEWNEIKRWCKRVLRRMEYRQLPPMHPECDGGTFMWEKCPFRDLCFGDLPDKKLAKAAYQGFSSVQEAWEEGHQAFQEEVERRRASKGSEGVS